MSLGCFLICSWNFVSKILLIKDSMCHFLETTSTKGFISCCFCFFFFCGGTETWNENHLQLLRSQKHINKAHQNPFTTAYAWFDYNNIFDGLSNNFLWAFLTNVSLFYQLLPCKKINQNNFVRIFVLRTKQKTLIKLNVTTQM